MNRRFDNTLPVFFSWPCDPDTAHAPTWHHIPHPQTAARESPIPPSVQSAPAPAACRYPAPNSPPTCTNTSKHSHTPPPTHSSCTVGSRRHPKSAPFHETLTNPDAHRRLMSQEKLRPSWVIEYSLNFKLFKCCGDEDLFPHKCRECSQPLILCYECETLYYDLDAFSEQLQQTREVNNCPKCGSEFPGDLMRSPLFRITFAEWHAAGLDDLLNEPPFSQLLGILTRSADRITRSLWQGNWLMAKIGITEYRNLSESLAEHFPSAPAFRNQGRTVAQTGTLSAVMEWHAGIPNSFDQAYALLGISDVIFP